MSSQTHLKDRSLPTWLSESFRRLSKSRYEHLEAHKTPAHSLFSSIRSVCHRHSLPGWCQISGQNPYNQKGHLKLLVFMNLGCHFCRPSLRIHGKHKKDDSMMVVMTCDLYQGSTLFLSGRLLKSINLNLPLNNYP